MNDLQGTNELKFISDWFLAATAGLAPMALSYARSFSFVVFWLGVNAIADF
jgi:hypothetical protein